MSTSVSIKQTDPDGAALNESETDAPATDSNAEASRVGSKRACGLLTILVLIVLAVGMPRMICIGDPVIIRNATINLLTHGTISVTEERAKTSERGQYYFHNDKTGRWYPKYGILNTFLYVPPLRVEQLIFGELKPRSELNPLEYARRCFGLNAYNILVSLGLAVYLYGTAALYLARPWANVGFVVLIFFGTCIWYYLRAQTVEIFQLLFFSGCFYHLVCYRRTVVDARAHSHPFQTTGRRASLHLGMCLLYAGLLPLEKLVFCPLTAMVSLWLLLADYDSRKPHSLVSFLLAKFRRPWASQTIIVLASVTVSACLVLTANWYRFGSPFTSGYGQWETEKNFLQGNVVDGICGFLVDPQKSVFLYFPPLLFAMYGARSFLRRFPYDGWFAVCIGASYLLLNSSFVNWRGDWCFGPRYLVFMLPMLALPALELFRTDNQNGKLLRQTLLAGLALSCFWLCTKQLYVNRIEFFAPFRAKYRLLHFNDEFVTNYFSQPHWTINRDLSAFASGRRPFPPLERLRDRMTEDEFQSHADILRGFAQGNHFWVDNPVNPFQAMPAGKG